MVFFTLIFNELRSLPLLLTLSKFGMLVCCRYSQFSKDSTSCCFLAGLMILAGFTIVCFRRRHLDILKELAPQFFQTCFESIPNCLIIWHDEASKTLSNYSNALKTFSNSYTCIIVRVHFLVRNQIFGYTIVIRNR